MIDGRPPCPYPVPEARVTSPGVSGNQSAATGSDLAECRKGAWIVNGPFVITCEKRGIYHLTLSYKKV